MPDGGLRIFFGADVESHQRSGPNLAWPDLAFPCLKCGIPEAEGSERNSNKLSGGDGSLS